MTQLKCSVSVYFQDDFEKTFAVYDENVTFQYFKSFRRARVNFSSPLFSANARIDLHEADVLGQRIKCFFFQVSCTKLMFWGRELSVSFSK